MGKPARKFVFPDLLHPNFAAVIGFVSWFLLAAPQCCCWLGAAGLALAERLVPFGYFVPTMRQLMGENLSTPERVATALQWSHLNHLRYLLLVLAWLTALRTFSLLYQRGCAS